MTIDRCIDELWVEHLKLTIQNSYLCSGDTSNLSLNKYLYLLISDFVCNIDVTNRLRYLQTSIFVNIIIAIMLNLLETLRMWPFSLLLLTVHYLSLSLMISTTLHSIIINKFKFAVLTQSRWLYFRELWIHYRWWLFPINANTLFVPTFKEEWTEATDVFSTKMNG